MKNSLRSFLLDANTKKDSNLSACRTVAVTEDGRTDLDLVFDYCHHRSSRNVFALTMNGRGDEKLCRSGLVVQVDLLSP